MSLDTYAHLQTALTSSGGIPRNDLSGQVTDWIYMFEQEMNLLLTRREMTKRLTFSTVANQESYTLPTDYGSGIALHRNDTPIAVMDPSDWDRMKLLYTTTAAPLQWAYVENKIMLGPVPDAVYTMELYYYAVLPNLSASNTTNWLLTAHPKMYFYGSLLEAATSSLIGEEQAQRWALAYQNALKNFKQKMAKDRNLGGGPLLRSEWPLARSGFNINTGEYR